MRVDRPALGTGESEDSPHSRPKIERHATDDKKPRWGGRPPSSRAVKPGHVFFVTGASCQKGSGRVNREARLPKTLTPSILC